jgi:hypothetical protein
VTKEEASAASATDGRMKKLVELLAAVQVTLDDVADRVETLEAIAAAGDRPDERYQDVDVDPQENGGSPAPAVDGAASRVPTREARSTPDLRWD